MYFQPKSVFFKFVNINLAHYLMGSAMESALIMKADIKQYYFFLKKHKYSRFCLRGFAEVRFTLAFHSFSLSLLEFNKT